MSLKWRDICVEKPKHGQKCLTRLCYGPMTGYYSAPHNMFHAWCYGEREWVAKHWVPIEEIDSEPPKEQTMTCRTCKSSFAPYELVEHQGEGKEASGLCLKCVHEQAKLLGKLFNMAAEEKEGLKQKLKEVVYTGDQMRRCAGTFDDVLDRRFAWDEVTKDLR